MTIKTDIPGFDRRPIILGAGLLALAAAIWLLPIDASCLTPIAIGGILVLAMRFSRR